VKECFNSVLRNTNRWSNEVNQNLHPAIAQALAPWTPPARGTEEFAQRRSEYRDECRAGFDCGPDDEQDEDDFEGAPV
jgi:hypothetical protein